MVKDVGVGVMGRELDVISLVWALPGGGTFNDVAASAYWHVGAHIYQMRLQA